MILHTRYGGSSGVVSTLDRTRMAFATNTLREPAFFKGVLARPLVAREAFAALYQVVVSDHKYRPRDRFAFQCWLEDQDRKFLANLALRNDKARARREILETRLGELDRFRLERLKPFHEARRAFFEYVYEKEYEIRLLLDPVITVHPDEISFEAFSRDESSYARVAIGYDLFDPIDAFECGTTNIDFSTRLHGELERMRSYRTTRMDIEPTGFSVSLDGSATHKEKKIDLPDSWVAGFLQVHSTMALALTRVSLAPVDLFNICRYLRRRKKSASPRSLRYEFTPGQKARAVIEPWNDVVELTGSEEYEGAKPLVIRTWGRQRLQTLARLIPVCKRINLYLAGNGLPSVYVLDLGEATFTLGLSGWTDNDWTGGAAKFDLLTRRANASAEQVMSVYNVLKEARYGSDTSVAQKAGIALEPTRAALSVLCQLGRGMLDLAGGVYRHRDLFAEPFTMAAAAKAVAPPPETLSPQERTARTLYERGDARIIMRQPWQGGYRLSGSVKADDGQRRPRFVLDEEGRVAEADCNCAFYTKHKLTKGPCEHILALRLAHIARLEQEGHAG